jgi:hypothetical protein
VAIKFIYLIVVFRVSYPKIDYLLLKTWMEVKGKMLPGEIAPPPCPSRRARIIFRPAFSHPAIPWPPPVP